jgi:RHS repeat-associated protein
MSRAGRILVGLLLLLAALGQPAQARVGNLFFSAPCRLFDTRSTGGPPRFGDGEQRSIVMAGSCGLPADTSAVFIALTAGNARAPGYLALQNGEARPTTTAIDYQAAETVTNTVAALLPADGSGRLQIFAASAVDVALDVVGYAASPNSQPSGSAVGPLGYQPVSGCRAADTRVEGGAIDAGEDRILAIQGRCNVPDSAPVAMLNVTTFAPARGGEIELHPRDEPPTTIAAMSYAAATDVAGAMPARLGRSVGSDLGIKNTSGGPAHVAVDAQGYFGFNAPGAFRAVTPCRLLDTREVRSPLRSAELRSVDSAPCRGAFGGREPVAVFVNLTVLAPAEDGELVTTLEPWAPRVSSLMSFTASRPALGHGSILPLDASGNVTLIANTAIPSEVHLVVDVYGYFERPPVAVAGAGSPLVLADGMHPANQRGVDPAKVYDFGGIDNVDLLSGNVSVSLPIGERYPVGGGLDYGLQLTYNSKVWDYMLRRVALANSWIYYTESVPNRISNAGLSWMLSLGGRLLSPSDLENNTGGPLINGQFQDPRPQWVWIGPDGGEHIFYERLNAFGDSPAGNMLWSRDGTYLRLRNVDSTNKDLEFADGTVYRFKLREQPLFNGGNENRWLLHQIRDQFAGNTADVDYQRSVEGSPPETVLKWVITDSHLRRQEVVFEPDPSGINPAGRARFVRLTAPHDQTAIWELTYTDTAVNRCRDTWPHNGRQVSVSYLTALKMPTSVGTSFKMTYESEAGSSCPQGLLTRLSLPTAGNALTVCSGGQHCAGIEWSYGDYQLPLAPCDGRAHFSLTSGVVEKRIYETTGAANPAGAWRYQPNLTATSDPPHAVQCPGDEFPGQNTIEHFYGFINTVKTPLYDRTVHHFSVLPRPNYESALPATVTARWQEYGLPLNRSVSIIGPGNKPLYLSEEIKDCTGDSDATCTTMAVKYVRYERDASLFAPSWPSTDRYDLQRRLAAERTVHLPLGRDEHYVESSQDDFDGLGHYRNVTTLGAGWGLAGAARTATTDYNSRPGADSNTYALDDDDQPIAGQHTYVSLAGRAPWRLDTFTSRGRAQGGSAEKEQTCFNASTGFLERRRLFANGASAGQRDVVVVYGKDAQGNVTSEEFYGGDRGTLSTTADVCAVSFPLPAPEYATRRTYNGGGGMLVSMEWMNGATTVLRRYLATIDVSGARVLSTTAPDEIRTDYHYDVLGRVDEIKPGNGQVGKFSAWTKLTYGSAAAAGCSAGNPDTCASLLVERFPPGSFTGTPLERRRHVFHGLGRTIRDGIRVPDATAWSEVVTEYDGMGHVSRRSERHTTNPQSFATIFEGYDVFGRPARIVPPTGAPQAVDLAYVGVRSETRTTKIARFDTAFPATPGAPLPSISEQPTKTTTTFDAQHRLVRVLDDSSGAAPNQLTTDYGYDVGDRLTTVRMTQPGTPVQGRDFVYDGLGRLRGEDHPELTHVHGGAMVCGGGPRARDVVYQSYDALGNLLRKCDDDIDLAYKYDRALRLTEVRRAGVNPSSDCTSEVGTCLTKLVYGSAVTTGNRSNGKVIQASSFNYRHDTAPNGSAMFALGEIVYDYRYDGNAAIDGGLSGRTLRWNVSLNPTLPPQPFGERFTQTFSYTPLGAPASVFYPSCDFDACRAVPPTRSISLGYTEGLLTNVSGYATMSYWPHPMLRRVTFDDGRLWQQDPDLSHLPRPRFICAPAPGTPTSADCTGGLGPYAYDGEGNVEKVGGETFAYDAYSRVVYGATSSGPYQRFGYDLFGNIQSKVYGTAVVQPGGGVTVSDSQLVSLTTSATTNRLNAAVYDARGNMTAWSGNTYRYDELGRLAVVHEGSNVRWYLYDVDGERVLSFEPSAFTPDSHSTSDWTLRGLDGKPLRSLRLVASGAQTWSWEKDYVYRDGAALAYETQAGRGRYLVDHLGTPRIIYAENGVGGGHHHFAFGEDAFFQSGDAEVIKFTGHERDLFDLAGPQDDMDYMHARHYNPLTGRFLSPDPLNGVEHRPQSWNRYAYVVGNPVRFVDPIGLFDCSAGVCQDEVTVTALAPLPSNPAERVLLEQMSRRRQGPGVAFGAMATGFADAAQRFVSSLTEPRETECFVAPPTGEWVCVGAEDIQLGVMPIGPPRFLSSVRVVQHGVLVGEGTIDLAPALTRVKAGVGYSGIFKNLGKPLPAQQPGYYTKYVVPTQGVAGAGPQRLIVGAGGEIYYTADHYATFIRIR